MKIKSLSLRNFRQHRSTNLAFSDGITCIVGPNGSGKTTLVEAIAFALYGSQALRGRVDDVLTIGAAKSDKFSVTVAFEHDGVPYRIERSKSGASLYFGGRSQRLATGATEVTRKITDLFGMSYREFQTTYFTTQKGLKFLGSEKGVADRERFVMKMLGMDKVERIQKKIREDRNIAQAHLAGIKSALGSRTTLEQKLIEEKKELERCKSELKDINSQYETAAKETARYREALSALEKKRDVHQELERQKIELSVRKEEITKRIAELKERKVQLSEKLNRKDLPTALEKLDQYLLKLRDEVKEKKGELSKIAEERNRAERNYLSECSRLKERAAAERRRYEALKDKLDRYSSLGKESSCPTCGQQLGSAFVDVCRGVEKELAEAKESLKKAEMDYKKARETEPALLRGLREREVSLGEIICGVEVELKKLEDLSAIEREFKDIDTTVSDLLTEEEELSKKLQTLGFEIDANGYDEQEYRACKTAYETAEVLLHGIKAKRIKIEGRVENARRMIERTKSEIASFDEMERRAAEMESKVLHLEHADSVLTDYRKHFAGSIRPALGELASRFIARLTDGRYATVELKEDFTPTVVEDGIRKAVISGGEEDLLNICVRLALSQIIAERSGHSFSMLIMDEILGSLDEERRKNTLTLLDGLRNIFDQVILITH
ncbi:MAG: hypothetical protein D6808_04570, partial [Candidatus Dadabacteria bacterium]